MADLRGGGYSAGAGLHSAFWSAATEDTVYLSALQRFSLQGPRDVMLP